MAANPKKLGQGALGNALAALYTVPASGVIRTHVAQLFLTNTGTSNRVVTLAAHGTAVTNQLFNSITLYANETKVIDLKVILAPNEAFNGMQAAGTDVTYTLYGVEDS